MTKLRPFVVPLVLLLLVATAGIALLRGDGDRKYVTANFPRAISLYVGSDVRILGVPVGKVESIEPDGTTVKVKMSYDGKYDVPADAQALMVAPSIVGDRYIQLTPVYSGRGAVLADGAELPEQRSAVPLELDQIYQSIDDLTVAVGPKGANKNGALSDLLDVAAENFAGQGASLKKTITDLGTLTGTLSNNKDELFGTARKLNSFVTTLSENDDTVRDFNTSLASASTVLAAERKDLATALENLGKAMKKVTTFVRDNKSLLRTNIKGLNRISKVLVKNREAIDQFAKEAPLAANNLGGTYNPQSGTLDTRANIGELPTMLQNDPALFLCGVLGNLDTSGTACGILKTVLGGSARTAALSEQEARAAAASQHHPTLRQLAEVGTR